MNHTHETKHGNNGAGIPESTDELSLKELGERIIQAAEDDYLTKERRLLDMERRIAKLEARLETYGLHTDPDTAEA